jgi:hypothetical protein
MLLSRCNKEHFLRFFFLRSVISEITTSIVNPSTFFINSGKRNFSRKTYQQTFCWLHRYLLLPFYNSIFNISSSFMKELSSSGNFSGKIFDVCILKNVSLSKPNIFNNFLTIYKKVILKIKIASLAFSSKLLKYKVSSST